MRGDKNIRGPAQDKKKIQESWSLCHCLTNPQCSFICSRTWNKAFHINIQSQGSNSQCSSFPSPLQQQSTRQIPWGCGEDGPGTAFPNRYWSSICSSGNSILLTSPLITPFLLQQHPQLGTSGTQRDKTKQNCIFFSQRPARERRNVHLAISNQIRCLGYPTPLNLFITEPVLYQYE